MALKQFEMSLIAQIKLHLIFLDLIEYRAISNAIAEQFGNINHTIDFD
jgi:hypothetical protein